LNPNRHDLVIRGQAGAWFGGKRIPCSIGKGGIRNDKQEGDGATPTGIYHLEHVYFRSDRITRPKFCNPTYMVKPFDGWSDDVTDIAYNNIIQRPYDKSHENLRRSDPLYNIIGVLDHNRHPAIAGNGSAIFMHLWRSPRRGTEGCLAFSYSNLLWILKNWRPQSKIIIYK